MKARLAILGAVGVLLFGACGTASDEARLVEETGESPAEVHAPSDSYSYPDDHYEEDEPDPDALADAYNESWDEACEEVWSNSPDGGLYYGGDGYSMDDCIDAKPYVDGTEFEDEWDAADQGESDGYDGAFELSPSEDLCWGDDCWDRYDY